MVRQAGVAYSITMRLEYPHRAGILGKITSAIGSAGGLIGAIDMVSAGERRSVRDVTVDARDVGHTQEIVEAVRSLPDVTVVHVSDQVFLRHLGGKIEMRSRSPVKTRNDMSLVYTPGVGRVCLAIRDDPESVWTLTGKGNTVAVITDGTAVLGLGDIGPAAAMPVMEGKALLFKEMAGVDAWPICLDTKDPDELVDTIKHLSVGFGGINLEDISAPRCFYVENRLKKELDIPIFHDDQHGTAVVTVAGLHNALKIVDKKFEDIKVVIMGAGASGSAVARLLIAVGVQNILGVDRQGILDRTREYGDNIAKSELARVTNPENIGGELSDAMGGADVFLGLAGPGLLPLEQVKRMAKDPIVFAMSNPDPEIWPEETTGHVRIMATGRSDYPNQVNSSLCFPGLFRGVLDVRARDFNDEMKLVAAKAITDGVNQNMLTEEYIIPGVFELSVVDAVAREVARVAEETGVARKVG